jgi:HSP20 family protein
MPAGAGWRRTNKETNMSLPENAKEEKEETRPIASWRSFPELQRMERQMGRLFENFFSSRWEPFRRRGIRPAREGDPGARSVDIEMSETKNEIVVRAELPGIDKDKIEVDVTDTVVTIKGEKTKQEEAGDERYYYAELVYGSFVRSLELPAAVQPDKVKASFKNGVLEIRLPKTEEAKRREIRIAVE